MKRQSFRTAFVYPLILIISTTSAAAQTGGGEPPARPQTAPRSQPEQSAAPQTTADEDFVLDITEKRITESDYEASTAVEAGDVGGRGLRVGVGVMLRAAEIDVLLRNVSGRVRFRGSLEPLLQRLGLRPTAPKVNPSP